MNQNQHPSAPSTCSRPEHSGEGSFGTEQPPSFPPAPETTVFVGNIRDVLGAHAARPRVVLIWNVCRHCGDRTYNEFEICTDCIGKITASWERQLFRDCRAAGGNSVINKPESE